MSVKPSARSNSSATYRGAMQMAGILGRRTVVVSRAPSAASARGVRTRPAAPATASVLRKRRRVCIIDIGTLPRKYRDYRAQPGNLYDLAFGGSAWIPGV